MKIKYYILLVFFGINLFSQNKIDLKEQCKLQYDSIFKDYFGEKFFKKNIRFDEEQYFLRVLDTVDVKSEDDDMFISFLVNKNNTEFLKKIYKAQYFDYLDYYNYSFLYKGKPFSQMTYTCETVNKKEYSDYEYRFIMNYYNKIKNKEYISPRKALKIAKANGLKNICYQSLTNASFYNKNQDVWQIQDCSNEKRSKVIEVNPKSGEVLTLFERGYKEGEKAAYWNLLK
ncbi:hypothetical protein PGH12_04625 [Chryseobacterium wangxinyae]|uniref:hypothetical protein n=1 Tax=Chryseobacterium sp. CY350 TaxID=2997336 RepID=UPI00227069CC|nr:hypothetical protein [Chryseobacterium sp. CY350]MCY0978665.1 hypothetical protein [Chryseobacterium sp. CY350]WBZ96434.1 hypothetical protein PGH12_04625 [Chryseobacterium sp. CY350]